MFFDKLSEESQTEPAEYLVTSAIMLKGHVEGTLAREEGLQGPGHSTVTVAQACTRVRSFHVCGRGYGGWFSPSTGQRSGLYVHPVGVALYQHAQDHRLLTLDILGYPGLFGDILDQPLISKVIPISGGQWRFNKESRDPPPPRGSQARR